MEKGTVLLSVEKYNELRDFKKYIEDGYTYRVHFGLWETSLSFIGTDKALEEMSKKLEEKQKEIDKLKRQLKKKDEELEDVRNMSWREFKKLKRR